MVKLVENSKILCNSESNVIISGQLSKTTNQLLLIHTPLQFRSINAISKLMCKETPGNFIEDTEKLGTDGACL
jgi:hypothetical protein